MCLRGHKYGERETLGTLTFLWRLRCGEKKTSPGQGNGYPWDDVVRART